MARQYQNLNFLISVSATIYFMSSTFKMVSCSRKICIFFERIVDVSSMRH